MKELQEERKELKRRLLRAKEKLQMSESKNLTLKKKLKDVGGDISSTLELEEQKERIEQVLGPTPKSYAQPKIRIPRLEELRKLGSDSLTPTSNSARDLNRRDEFGMASSSFSPNFNNVERLLHEN